MSVCNYAVFFCLTWHLWATQTTYQIKYYTNDWWHRALFVSLLGIYAALAACSGSFSVGWEINSDTMNIFTGNATSLTAEVIRTNEENSMVRSFEGVNIVLFFSRMLLLVQHLRVLWYRRKSNQMWSWRFYLVPVATFIAGFIFLGCFIIMQERPHSKSAAITQLFLWGLAIGIQVLAAAKTPEDGDKVLKNQGDLSPRLSTLTVIILGEGLNGICSTFRHSINSLGLTPKMAAEALSVLLVLYFIWLVYFDGFRIKFSSSRALGEMWLWLHFPLHLSLIMLLEGTKNVFLFNNVINAVRLISSAYDHARNEHGVFQVHPRSLEKLLLPLKISWAQELEDLKVALGNSTANQSADNSVTDQSPAVDAQLYRWIAGVIHNIYLLFNDEPDPEAESAFNGYIASNDTVLYLNSAFGLGDGTLLDRAGERYRELMAYSARWLIAMAGALLVCMAILNIMQRRPKNRFAWGYSLNRTVIGVTLILFGGLASRNIDLPHNETWVLWIIPTVAISYFAITVIDWVILCFSIHSIRRKEVLFGSQPANAGEENGFYDTEKILNIRQHSGLPYDQYRGRDVAVSSSAAETLDSDIESDQPRKQGWRDSSGDLMRRSLLEKGSEGGTLAPSTPNAPAFTEQPRGS
ncbi:hypothetical protein FRC05_008952 [Tulasnella sp. 425]|nr:hypothetical protein FRC05_008952 [Tulasnella sp. 425]